jgi:hypothetical protein
MRVVAACLIVLFLSTAGVCQTGNYFLAHYAPGNEHFHNVCFDIDQDENGIMYFATKSGILSFDGSNWDLIKRKAAVYSIHINEGGLIFWSGANGFGKVTLDENGFQKLESFRDSTDSDIVQTLSTNDEVFFLSEESLFIYDRDDESITDVKSDGQGNFTRLFELFGAIYINTDKNELYRIENRKLSKSNLGISGDIVFQSRIEDDYVIGTGDNKLYTINENLKPQQIVIEDQAYATASVVVNGSWINRQLLAIGTLRGGIMFVNPITGKTQEIINYSTGLPDNEVFAMMGDRNQNIWVSHDYGFTRISPYMPFRSYSHYPGLEGNLLCAFTARNAVYVGTSLGLFQLKKEDVFDELTYFVDVPIAGEKSAAKQTNGKGDPDGKADAPHETESKKRGIFGFLKRNKAKDRQVIAGDKKTEETVEEMDPEPAAQPRFKKEKRTQKILRASQYVYTKVNGIDAKITNLVEVNGHLIASGLGGIFEVDDLQSRCLLKEPIHYLYASTHENILFASTYDDNVRTLIFESNKWQPIDLFDNIDDQINYIFESENRELWLCGMSKIYQYKVTDYNIDPVQTINLSNYDAEKTLGITLGSDVMFINTEGFYKLNREAATLERVDSLPAPLQYFAHHGSMIYLDQHGWNLEGKLDGHGNLKLLNLFKDLRFITTEAARGDLWVISGSNELYKLFGERIALQQETFPVLIKSLSFQKEKKGFHPHLSLSEDKSDITFEVVQPDYISPDAVEFRYLVTGMKQEEWSKWSADNNTIHFTYLPPGEYTLNVQTKNIFGRVTDLKPYTFQVLPPYWKRSWFYAMEFALIASLVLLSFRLNTKYRIISRVLSLLTIILLIEFIQTVINSTIPFQKESPVVDFIVQVIVALMILPVEGYLRKLMFRSLDGSSKFYQFIAPKSANGYVEPEETEQLQESDDR